MNTNANTGTAEFSGAAFWEGFAVQEDCAYDETDAAAFARACADELTNWLHAVTVLDAALAQGRNPLVRGARRFTENQLETLRDDAVIARRLLAATLDECANAFGTDGAAKLYEYVLRGRDDVLNEAANQPGQLDLFS